MGRYKVETFAQHDSMQPYKTWHGFLQHQLSSLQNAFSSGCFFMRKSKEAKKSLFEVQAPWYTKEPFLKSINIYIYIAVFGYQIWTF